MRQLESVSSLRVAWIITVLAVLALSAFTALLTIRSLDQTGAKAYVTSSNPTVYMRDEPSGSGRIVGVLSRGQQITLLETSERDGRLWVRIRANGETGWLSVSNLSSAPPEESR